MRWQLLLAVFGLSVSCVASFAQRPPGDQPPASARSISHADSFFETTGMVRFNLIQGRLCLDPLLHRKGSQRREESGQHENVTVTADRGIPSLHYVFESAHQQITMSVHQATSFRLESWLLESNERCVLVQPESSPITLSLRRGDLTDDHRGATLLHVRHSDCASFDRHFGLLLERMLRGRTLPQISQATETVVFQQIRTFRSPDIQMVRQQVDRLGSPRRATRMLAVRQLLTWGTPILPLLRSIPEYELDTEQKSQVAAIARQLRSGVEDTPASLANLVANDPTYWSAVASRLDRDQFQIASAHLQRLGGQPLEVPSVPDERIAAARE